jgi:AcrR family transcriptional regulator
MPRVPAAHLDARRTQVRQAAARRFAANGFNATSMADVIAESGLSAGAVYRYYAGKDDLIAAVAAEAFGSVEDLFGRLLADGASPSPREVVGRYLDALVDPSTFGGLDLGALLLQAWAQAVRTEPIRVVAEAVLGRIREGFVEATRRWQAAGNLPAGIDPQSVGTAMLACAQGLLLQRLIDPGTVVDGVDDLFGWTAPSAPSSAPALEDGTSRAGHGTGAQPV